VIFNSFDFAVFLPIVFAIYWAIGSKRLQTQNIWLLFASYVFYAWWDWRFLSLIVLSSLLDFFIGLRLEKNDSDKKRKKGLLLLSIAFNIGCLIYFKYMGFFVESFAATFQAFGLSLDSTSLNIILPVGISFYTFQTLSYSIDVYRGKLKATKNLLGFMSFVTFFPQLVAGPIERAEKLLPQFNTPRVFDYQKAVDGTRQMLWGFFKKMVIADNCATIVDAIYANPTEHSGSTLALATFFFAIQIYCDFSGYSDIAIGLSRLFGFELMRNFAFPYFSRDIAEFWRRWHISLSTWFRDYSYIPLGGSRGGRLLQIRNVLIIFLVSGFWHGANWTFIVWGAIHALCFLPVLLLKQNRKNLDNVAPNSWLPNPKELIQMALTFGVVCLAWVFFRANNVNDAFIVLKEIFSESVISAPTFPKGIKKLFILFIPVLFAVEWLARDRQHGLDFKPKSTWKVFRFGVYLFLILVIIMFRGDSSKFIYFQF
tara:strand:- start:65371 stop:66819 length:1449 start_codon:yes stop_codon:yes gene_type:complete